MSFRPVLDSESNGSKVEVRFRYVLGAGKKVLKGSRFSSLLDAEKHTSLEFFFVARCRKR